MSVLKPTWKERFVDIAKQLGVIFAFIIVVKGLYAFSSHRFIAEPSEGYFEPESGKPSFEIAYERKNWWGFRREVHRGVKLDQDWPRYFDEKSEEWKPLPVDVIPDLRPEKDSYDEGSDYLF